MLSPAPLQTTYNQYLTVAQVGTPATMTGWDVDNRIVEDPTGISDPPGTGIGFGLAVCQGYQSDKGVTIGQLSGGVFIGISRADVTLPRVEGRTVDTYYNTENIAVQTRGDIWVAPISTVNSGDPVYFDSVTGQLGNSGIANAVLIDNSRWQTSLPNAGQPTINFNGLAVARLGASAQ